MAYLYDYTSPKAFYVPNMDSISTSSVMWLLCASFRSCRAWVITSLMGTYSRVAPPVVSQWMWSFWVRETLGPKLDEPSNWALRDMSLTSLWGYIKRPPLSRLCSGIFISSRSPFGVILGIFVFFSFWVAILYFIRSQVITLYM